MLDMLPLALPLLLVAQEPSADVSALQAAVERLRSQVAALETRAHERDEDLSGMRGALKLVEAGVTELRSRPVTPPSEPFIAAPPPSSDAVGVAKTVVFAPRIEVDTPKRRDIVSVKLRRVEEGGARLIAEKELANDEGLELPIDQNGALYIAEWSTTEGQTFGLLLRDGTSGQTAATAQVKVLQTQGRFLFVGYRAE